MSGTSKSSSSFYSLSSSLDSGALATTPVAMAEGVTSGFSSSLGLGEEHFEWVHENVLSYHSDMADFEVESLSQQEEWVHGLHPPQFALTHCSPSERALMMTPFASVFLNHYTIRVGKKVGWITALGEASFFSDRQPLPLYWKLPMRDQVTPKSQLSPKEKAVFQLLDELPRGMNCRELVALIREDGSQDYMRSVLKKKGLDMDALIHRAKGILSTDHVSTQKESDAVEVVSVSSSTKKEPMIVAEEESANPVSEKESTIPIAEKESVVPEAEKELAEQVVALIMTKKSSTPLMVDEGPVQTGERLMPEGSNKRKATTPIAEEVPGKRGKGALSLSISQGQPKGKVVVTSSPKLPLGGLPCYVAPSSTNSLWGPEANIRRANNTFDMLEAYHVRSLASLEVWRDLVKRVEHIVAREALNKKEFEKMAKANADLKAENDRNKAKLAKLKSDREDLWADVAASKSKATVAETKMMQ
ncbi:hypothetical protein CR513_02572, partial [Mucuna pruriens]